MHDVDNESTGALCNSVQLAAQTAHLRLLKAVSVASERIAVTHRADSADGLVGQALVTILDGCRADTIRLAQPEFEQQSFEKLMYRQSLLTPVLLAMAMVVPDTNASGDVHKLVEALSQAGVMMTVLLSIASKRHGYVRADSLDANNIFSADALVTAASQFARYRPLAYLIDVAARASDVEIINLRRALDAAQSLERKDSARAIVAQVKAYVTVQEPDNTDAPRDNDACPDEAVTTLHDTPKLSTRVRPPVALQRPEHTAIPASMRSRPLAGLLNEKRQ